MLGTARRFALPESVQAVPQLCNLRPRGRPRDVVQLPRIVRHVKVFLKH
eukprot:SAG31_NODE_40172_length_282_cov_1.404372_1_plen_48_part_01